VDPWFSRERAINPTTEVALVDEVFALEVATADVDPFVKPPRTRTTYAVSLVEQLAIGPGHPVRFARRKMPDFASQLVVVN
jgi:hypothetical protein